MLSKRVFFSAFFTLLALSAWASSQTNPDSGPFTIQVAAFPDAASAGKFVNHLTRTGERPAWGAVKIPGRGVWVRVFIGSFATAAEARHYGDRLVAHRIVEGFVVKSIREMRLLHTGNWAESLGKAATGLQEKDSKNPESLALTKSPAQNAVEQAEFTVINTRDVNPPSGNFGPRLVGDKFRKGGPALPEWATTAVFTGRATTVWPPPVAASVSPALAPEVDTSRVPRPDPARLAFRLILRDSYNRQSPNKQGGGLWLTGDVAEGLERLRWIAGDENADLLYLDQGGQVHLDIRLLACLAGAAEKTSFAAPLKVAEYIAANEGLLLLVQLTQGTYRHRLHIGAQAPTYHDTVAVSASLNLDNNFDSRINPYRREGKKLDRERPPRGYDSLVAINPAARWWNLQSKAFVLPGTITFHELAEAYAKLELGLDYLPQDHLPGAHNIAVERETILKAQRPFSNMVVTTGSNRVLRSEEEYRQFSSESGQR